jgi:hypothetical protein
VLQVPFLIIPAHRLGVQGGMGPTGTRQVVIRLTNPVAQCTFPMDLEQAREHVENVQRAILEAQGTELPPAQRLVTP